MDYRVVIFNNHPNLNFTVLTTVFSFFALSPTPSSVPIVLTLTTLLVYGRILFPGEHSLRNTSILTIGIAVAGALARLSPSLDALSSAGVSIIILSLLSLITSALAIAVVYLDTRLCTRFNAAWSQLTFFPALWATLWFGVSFVSPVGRLSAWSSTDVGGYYGWLAPYLGPVGNDWVVAAWAVVLSQAIGTWYIGENQEEPPLIAHTAAPATKKPSYLSHLSSSLLLTTILVLLAVPSMVLSNYPLPIIPPAVTPLSVGCVLPAFQRYKHHKFVLEDYVKETARLTSSARVLLWPEGAVTFNSEAERSEGLAKVRKVATGSVVGVSFEEAFGDDNGKSSRRTGIAVISQASPEPQLVYFKRHLVPVAESFSLSHSLVPPSIVTLDLSAPKDVNKTDWVPSGPPYTRPVPISASICLDFAAPAPFAELESKPALILAPARTWDIAVGNAMWQQARQRADELSTMILWCDGGDGGVSGVTGGGFRDFTQVGPGSWVKTIGIQYPFDDRRTTHARVGDLALLFIWLLVLGGSVLNRVPFRKHDLTAIRNKIFSRQNVANGPREGNLLNLE
ncbi:hypothetical protein DXG03_008903 [Asterophora parasitica]|uniref:CN hydrolase domain-containing protein n=1 Tax=Asterophora parasitica TaxID=117018 RepID=A0A9P7KG68_9AGAR|nr:hypothetical protein DXG03_008903 [Asterophora parasitica]